MRKDAFSAADQRPLGKRVGDFPPTYSGVAWRAKELINYDTLVENEGTLAHNAPTRPTILG